jgi:hypothetical protein
MPLGQGKVQAQGFQDRPRRRGRVDRHSGERCVVVLLVLLGLQGLHFDRARVWAFQAQRVPAVALCQTTMPPPIPTNRIKERLRLLGAVASVAVEVEDAALRVLLAHTQRPRLVAFDPDVAVLHAHTQGCLGIAGCPERGILAAADGVVQACNRCATGTGRWSGGQGRVCRAAWRRVAMARRRPRGPTEVVWGCGGSRTGRACGQGSPPPSPTAACGCGCRSAGRGPSPGLPAAAACVPTTWGRHTRVVAHAGKGARLAR